MAHDRNVRPLKQRIGEKITAAIDRVVDAIQDLISPEPELVPVPIRPDGSRRR